MKRIFNILWLILFTVGLSGQQTTISVDAPQTVTVGQGFRLVYSIESGQGEFVAPAFDPSFNVSGPQQSTSRNVQWVNGEVSAVSQTTIIYYIVPTAKGKYTIPPAQLVSKKTTISSEQVEIEVVDAGTVNSQTAAGAQRTSTGGAEVSLKMFINPDEVYVGQPVTVTLKLFTRVSLAGLNDLKYPDFKGFLREDIQTEPPKELTMETIDGVQYGTAVIQKFMLFPQVAGDMKIDPVQLTALVQKRTSMSNPFFDDPFFNDPFFTSVMSNVTTVPQVIATEAKTIKVRTLPQPQPADFYGAVGTFELKSTLSKTTIEVNDALTYTVTLSGNGNLNLSGPPSISFPQGIEKYDPKVNVKNPGTGTGTKTFEYLLIPRHNGTFEIPPLSYTVFDLKQGRYVTLRSQGYTVTVTGSSSAPEANVTTVPVQGDEIKYVGQDIRFIRSDDMKLETDKLPLISKTTYWLWFIMTLFVAATALLVRREYVKRNSDITGLRNRKAANVARKRLSKAKSLLGGNDPTLVNEELAKAIWGFLGDKLSIPVSDLSRDRCFSALRERNAGEEIIAEVDRILTSCEYSRFSPSGREESPEELFRKTVGIIKKLEDLV